MRERRSRPFRNQVHRQVKRRLLARRRRDGFWRNLGIMGMVGWSVATPMLAGALLGRWLDSGGQAGRSWTLTLMLAGLVLGCWTAASWLVRERQELEREQEEDSGDA